MFNWLIFWLNFLVATIVLFLPGTLVAKGLRFNTLFSLVIAAPISCCLYGVSGIITYQLGWLGIGPLLALSVGLPALFFCISWLLQHRNPNKHTLLPLNVHLSWKIAALFVVSAVVVYGLAYLYTLRTPLAFNQNEDSVAHLSYLKDMLISGNFSMLHAGYYNGVVPAAQVVSTWEGLYPMATLIPGSITLWITGAALPIIQNATICVFMMIVFPVGSYGLLQALFKQSKSSVMAGALCTVGAAYFPLRTLVWYSLFTFVGALCLIPAFFLLAYLFFETPDLRRRLAFWIACILALVGITCAHPGATLAVYAMLAVYVIFRGIPVLLQPLLKHKKHRKSITVLAQLATAAAWAGIWWALYKAPFMAPQVAYYWQADLWWPSAVFSAASLALRWGVPALPLMFLLAIGCALALSKKNLRWLVGTFAFMCLLYIIDDSFDNGLQHLFAGFWYNDQVRISDFVVLWAIPLTSLGLAALCNICMKVVSLLAPANVSVKTTRRATLFSLLGLFCLLNFAPSLHHHDLTTAQRTFYPTPWGDVIELINNNYKRDNMLPFNAEKQAFTQQVKAIVGDDGVINFPYDGSVFSRPINDLNIYYHDYKSYGDTRAGERDAWESEDSRIIRENLANIASNDAVKEAVERSGAHYVVLYTPEALAISQQSGGDWQPALTHYSNTNNWLGVLSVTDSTPGFEPVLANGTMRLYRITALDDE